MATSARAQELAEQLLGLENTRAPLPVEKQRFQGGMDSIKGFVQRNKKAVTIAAVVVGAIVVYAGYKAYEKKKQNAGGSS
jgi:hypothetical protein